MDGVKLAFFFPHSYGVCAVFAESWDILCVVGWWQ
jgi:hypothetical protein